jgi:hypothetical protein
MPNLPSGLDASRPPKHRGVKKPFWSVPDLTGESYRSVLQRFHNFFRPATYLEIGVLDGKTLELASCDSIAIDPRFILDRPLIENKPSCCLYNMTSDTFFKRHSPSSIFGQSIEMAFLDGMHWFEFLLRDFINVEKHCKPNSIIFLHDCMPTDEYVARRDVDDKRLEDVSAHLGWWAGDVWKVTDILLKHRKDLRVIPFNADPTGLVAVTGLNPSSTILADNYFRLIYEYKDKDIAACGDEYLRELNAVDTSMSLKYEDLSSLFWL